VEGVERSLSRLIGEVKKTELELRKDVEDLERESSPSYIATHQASSASVKKSSRSAFQMKSDKLEKSKALRLATQVSNRCRGID